MICGCASNLPAPPPVPPVRPPPKIRTSAFFASTCFKNHKLGAKIANLVPFGRPLGSTWPNLEPSCPQDPSTWSQDGFKNCQLGAKMASRTLNLELKFLTWLHLGTHLATLQNGAKMASRTFNLEPTCPQEPLIWYQNLCQDAKLVS